MSDHDQSSTGPTERDDSESDLSENDKALQEWFAGLALQDPRYNNKVILKLAALAMGDDEFRTRVVEDTESVLREIGYAPEDGTELHVHDNTGQALHLVLPSRPENRSPQLRELLSSRTSVSAFSLARDDWDFGDLNYPADSDSGDEALDGHPAEIASA